MIIVKDIIACKYIVNIYLLYWHNEINNLAILHNNYDHTQYELNCHRFLVLGLHRILVCYVSYYAVQSLET